MIYILYIDIFITIATGAVIAYMVMRDGVDTSDGAYHTFIAILIVLALAVVWPIGIVFAIAMFLDRRKNRIKK